MSIFTTRPRVVRRVGIATLVAALTGALALPGSAGAVDPVNTTKLTKAVTVGGILSHERALQRIANENGGTRASGTPGYAASVAYVRQQMKAAGYKVKVQEFAFDFFRELAPSSVTEVSPTPGEIDSVTLTYSGSGDVTGPLVPTNDIQVPPGSTPSSSNAGCEASDFTPAPSSGPAVALLQRGTCTFEVKAANAEAAGYDAVVIFNEGQPGRTEAIAGTLGRVFDIPVVGLSYEDGAALYQQTQAGAVTVRVQTSTESQLDAPTYNVIADSPAGKKSGETVVVGAHLDSVTAGPGINDNGSGSATILEIAKQMSALGINTKLQRPVRFVFFGAEELGLLGSTAYVNSLSTAQRAQIYANLNFDMVGSPNYVRFVYDGDGSSAGVVGPPGSGEIESIFTGYFEGKGLASAPTPFDGRSDYGPFIAAGIPAGGLFSGAEGIKTEAQAAEYGGTAGEAYDKCYHQACDTITNLNAKALDELGDAAAHATGVLALSKAGLFPDGSRRAAPAKSASTATHQGHQLVR